MKAVTFSFVSTAPPQFLIFSRVLRDSTPALSIRLFIHPSIRPSIGVSATFYFFHDFLILWSHCSCLNGLVTSKMTNWPADGWTKRGVESRRTQLKTYYVQVWILMSTIYVEYFPPASTFLEIFTRPQFQSGQKRIWFMDFSQWKLRQQPEDSCKYVCS